MDLQGMKDKHDNFQMFDCDTKYLDEAGIQRFCKNKADILTDKRRRLCNKCFETSDDKQYCSLRHESYLICTCSFASTIRMMDQVAASQSISTGLISASNRITQDTIKAVEQLNLSGGSLILTDEFLKIQSAVLPRICDLSNEELLDQIHYLDRLKEMAVASKIIVHNYLSDNLKRSTDKEREIIRDKDKSYRAAPKEKVKAGKSISELEAKLAELMKAREELGS